MIETLWRGGTQCDIHLPPTLVQDGEDRVLVESANVAFSEPRDLWKVASFLGVMPGDIVEMAVDVVAEDTQEVVYARSVHKECLGIYDAWDVQYPLSPRLETAKLKVTFTVRVNGLNRSREGKSLFEGLVRLIF
jgi:hypothetical protein